MRFALFLLVLVPGFADTYLGGTYMIDSTSFGVRGANGESFRLTNYPEDDQGLKVYNFGGGQFFRGFGVRNSPGSELRTVLVADISNLTFPIVSGSLGVGCNGPCPNSGDFPVALTLWDVSTPVSEFLAETPTAAAFADAGSGSFYGWNRIKKLRYHPFTGYDQPVILGFSAAFNRRAIDALNAAVARGDQYFMVGAQIDAPPIDHVPEPYALALLALSVAMAWASRN